MARGLVAIVISFWLMVLPAFAAAKPKVVGLEFEKREVKPGSGPARLRRRATTTADLWNAQGDLLYLINCTVGTPPQVFALHIDTGSSDIWLPWAKSPQCSSSRRRCQVAGQYDETASSSYRLLQASTFSISYVDGTRIRGDYIADTFSVGGANVPNTTMGLSKSVTEQEANSDFQGIMGIGFEVGEAIHSQTGQTYENIVTLMKKGGHISSLSYSLWLNDMDNGKGSLLFGGIDTEKFRPPLIALPVQPDARTDTVISFTVAFDSITVLGPGNSVQYSRTNLSLPVILDSGTTLTYLPDEIARDIYNGVGAVQSATYGVVVACELMYSQASITFRFGNANGPLITAPIREFVIPFPDGIPKPTFRSNNKEACRWGIQASQGRPNLFGDTFLRSAYVVYNLESAEIALANAVVNTTKSNVIEINGRSIPSVSSTAAGVVAKQTATGQFAPGGVTRTGTASMTVTGATGTFNLGSPTATTRAGIAPSIVGGGSLAPVVAIVAFLTTMVAGGMGVLAWL